MTDDEQSGLTVLVTGATGFIGRRLVPALARRGVAVKAMTRNPDGYDGPGGAVHGDVHDAGSLAEALTGVDVAIYLVHSLDDPDFERKDADAARSFGLAAAATGVRQIVYMGGLGADGDDLSPHLRSRREVETLLGESGVPVTVLRAAIVVGAGGISWEMTRQLVKNLPAMVVPRWAATRTQPVAIDDVVRYICGVVGHREAFGRIFEIGGPDQLSYIEMLQGAAEVMTGRRLPIARVPVLTPKLSSYWISFVTNVDTTTGRNLIDSMGNEVLVTDHSIRDIVPGEPLTYLEAVRRAVEEDGADR
ncbi:MAG: NAD-dependent epimerase/dehydratase [Nocardioides sp.]|nr:NAD-dependent epimerase/dehydratase [Nocardioides sp.]